MAIGRANAYGNALLSELRSGADGAAEDLLSLSDVSMELSAHVLRMIHAQEPNPAILLGLIRHLITAYAETRDPLMDRALRHHRAADYGWYCSMLREWVGAVMRRRAQAAYSRGEWGSCFGWAVDATVLRYYLLRLRAAGVAARWGMAVSIAAPADALLALAQEYSL